MTKEESLFRKARLLGNHLEDKWGWGVFAGREDKKRKCPKRHLVEDAHRFCPTCGAKLTMDKTDKSLLAIVSALKAAGFK